jgi:glycosyltransferase involved in cell wall biosynthesis
MRVLFLTNFYQASAGGEEQSCQQVVQGLQQRGHTTLVLTSMHGTGNVPVEQDGISRSLYLEMDMTPLRHSVIFFTQRKSREQHNLQVFERVVRQFDPDIIFIWGMWNLPYSLAAFAESKYPNKVAYRFASYWPTLPSQHEMYWRAPGRSWYSRITKKVLGLVALAMLRQEARRPALEFRDAFCVSLATKSALIEAGVPVSHAKVIHTGLDVEPYLRAGQYAVHGEGNELNVLYAGRLTPDKGVDTAIQAMAKIVERGQRNIKLSLAGSGSEDYEHHLRGLISQSSLSDTVAFLGWVSPEEMPELLRKFDVLVVPSTWAEPFARVTLEGMISGLAVIATPTGGTTEILNDGENGLLFGVGDAEDLAEKITRLSNDRQLLQRLVLAGQQTVIERFTKTKMMDEIEAFLQDVVRSSSDEKAGQLVSQLERE